MGRRQGIAVLCLFLLAAQASGQQQWNPFEFLSKLPKMSLALESKAESSDYDACTTSKSFTRPQLAKVNVCASSKAVSANGAGLVASFANSTLSLRNQASVACSEAVGNSIKGMCLGLLDPMAAISSVATTCASALVEAQMESVSGVEITPATDVPLISASKKAWTQGCASGCANGQLTAEAVAQASACAWTTATKGCNAVRLSLSSQAYSNAFIKTTASAWSNVCSLGIGKAISRGEAQVKTMVDVLSKAMGDVVGTACSSCDTCKCQPLPPGFSYDKMDALSKASATASTGSYTMGKAFSTAVASYCDSDQSTKSLQANVNATINTMAVMLADVMVKTTSSNNASGVAMACSGGSISQQIRASKNAYINALNDATSLVFDGCANANTQMKNMVNSLSDSIDKIYNSVSSECAKAMGSPKVKSVNAVNVVQKKLFANKPLVKAVAEALQDSVSCGCKPGNCFFCKPSSTKNATSVVSAYDLGNNKTGSGNAPLYWNALAGSN